LVHDERHNQTWVMITKHSNTTSLIVQHSLILSGLPVPLDTLSVINC